MKKLKKYLTLTLSLVILFISTNTALANDIESIDIQAEIQDDASVVITEHRIFNAYEGSEHYLSFSNLGESELLDFKVFEKGKQLEDVGAWDVDKSIEQKAGKYGVNQTPDGFELCFGISSLGRKDFTIQYRISNFVRSLEDGKQAIYWQFINPGMDPISKVNISVKNTAGFIFEYPHSKIWGFGFEGKTEITEDALLMETEGFFSSDNYMVLLSIFPENTFSTSASYPFTEESLKDYAMEGASPDPDYPEYEPDYEGPTIEEPGLDPSFIEDSSSFLNARFLLAPILAFALPLIFFIAIGATVASKKKKQLGSKFKTTISDGTYHRDIPYRGNIIELGSMLGASTKDYISSLILKWIKEKRLRDEKELAGFIFKKEKLALVINRNIPFPDGTPPSEIRLWNMVVSASGQDLILSEKEFTKYMSRNLEDFNIWLKDINKESEKALKNKGFLKEVDKKFLFFNYKEVELTDKGQDLLDNVMAFKNYLKDFSLLAERQVSEVKLWDQYMIWAAFLGISEEVYQQLKILDPQAVQGLDYSYQTIILTNAFANTVSYTHSSLSSSNSSFSGAGGSSFGGGGGGASGGSFGGGTR
ncbi:MAG: DUF2207 domain-containing protein [Tissierellia bacterium]|nr:DUF2207 domain-containing protein [Tissierellia bacterium]